MKTRQTAQADQQMTDVVAAADSAVLRATLAYLTSDLELLDLDDDAFRDAAPELIDFARHAVRPAISRATLARIASACAGAELADDYMDFLEELLSGHSAMDRLPATATTPQVVIIGAGMSGLCAAMACQQAGIPYTVLEKNQEVGGTWFENAYPGCAVDTPSHLYDYSFTSSSAWPWFFSKRDDLLAYFKRCAAHHGVQDRIRLGTEVQSVRFDDLTGTWTVAVRDASGHTATVTGDVVISAVGMLNRPRIPAIAGMETFTGPVLHTARWDPQGEDVGGKRVAVIGTGASAIQLVPAIAGKAARVTVFQRSPHWMVPNPLYHSPITAEKRWLLEHLPSYQEWFRFRLFWIYGDATYPAIIRDPAWTHADRSVNATNDRFRNYLVRHIEREIGDDPQLLAKVVPSYPPFTKRMLIDNHWYRTLRRPDVELVTDAIDHVVADGVITATGSLHRADMIVFATGFETSTMLQPLNIWSPARGPLNEQWGDDPRAYLGITIPGYPNLFCLYGPNTNLGHGGSAFFQTECQMRYIMGCLRLITERGWRTIECRKDVHDVYNERVDATHERLVWTHPGASNWFRNAAGRVTTNSPWRMIEYWQMTRRPDPADYITSPRLT